MMSAKCAFNEARPSRDDCERWLTSPAISQQSTAENIILRGKKTLIIYLFSSKNDLIQRPSLSQDAFVSLFSGAH